MKTVTFDDEAYQYLRSARLTPKESFSSVVKRLAGNPSRWEDSAGGWGDMSKAEIARLRAESIGTFGWVE